MLEFAQGLSCQNCIINYYKTQWLKIQLLVCSHSCVTGQGLSVLWAWRVRGASELRGSVPMGFLPGRAVSLVFHHEAGFPKEPIPSSHKASIKLAHILLAEVSPMSTSSGAEGTAQGRGSGGHQGLSPFIFLCSAVVTHSPGFESRLCNVLDRLG